MNGIYLVLMLAGCLLSGCADERQSSPSRTPVIPVPTETATPARPGSTWMPTAGSSPTASLPPTAGLPPTTMPPTQSGALRYAPQDGAPQVFVPGGTFRMGSSEDDPYALPDEKPQRTVFVESFWIDQYEVTNARYARCVTAGACQPPYYSTSSTRSAYYGSPQYADYPVILVEWAMANAYCTWAGRRLPTEAEWEKAARGVDGRIFPWGNTLTGKEANLCDRACPFAWKETEYDDGYPDTSPVGAFPLGASPYGALDMAGNAWEWVAGWYAATGQFRVVRGGTWFYGWRELRAAARKKLDPGYMSNLIGFRCANDY